MPTRPQLPDPAQTCARGPRLYDPKGTVLVLLGMGTGTVSDRWRLCVIDGPMDRLSSMSSDCVDDSSVNLHANASDANCNYDSRPAPQFPDLQ